MASRRCAALLLALAPAAALRLAGGVGLRTRAGAAAPTLPSPHFSDDFGPSTQRKADWASAYRTVGDELEYEADVEGTLPDGLRGTLFRNGPGRLERGGHAYAHLFDGDGMLVAFRFDGGGRVRVQNRFVRTAEYEAEEAAGRLLYRNTFVPCSP